MTEEIADERWRPVLFRMGAAAAVISAAAGICTCVARFPLLSDGQGGWRLNPLEDQVLMAGLCAGLLAMILGAFGKGVGRVLLMVTAIALMLFNLIGWLGNHR